MESIFDILQTVAVGVFVNLITPRVRKWLTSQEVAVMSTTNRAE